MTKELLSVDEVAAYLDVRPVTVYRWCREGRLPAAKIGKAWRIRRSSLDDFLRRGERAPSLVGQLRAFFQVPDHVIAVAETEALLHRLDAAFFQVGEARGGVLVKFHAGEPASADELRAAFTRRGLEVDRLEAAGRFRFSAEEDPLAGRAGALRRLLEEVADDGRSIWAAFDWVERVSVEEALRQQDALRELVDAGRLVIKTCALERVVDEWEPAAQRRAQFVHRGMIWLSERRLTISRGIPTPPD